MPQKTAQTTKSIPVETAPEAVSQPKTDAEAALVFQQGVSTGQPAAPDPLADAIQKELGTQLNPSALVEAADAALANGFGQDEGEVFRCMNLTKAYGEGSSYTEVIKGISFSVKQGEYIVIYGPSGSGKSTLLHMLAGLEPPSRGEIKVGNHTIQEFTDDEVALYHREEVGLVFQSFNLLESLRVWENVAFPLMLSGAPLEWRKREALKMLDRFQLLDYANHYPSQLSGGQQQRTALARALIHDPDLLLIDEPTGNLDSRSAQQVIDEIARLHEVENRTIILVTHSKEFLQHATRVFYIRDGTLLTSAEHAEEGGKPGDSTKQPETLLQTPGEQAGMEQIAVPAPQPVSAEKPTVGKEYQATTVPAPPESHEVPEHLAHITQNPQPPTAVEPDLPAPGKDSQGVSSELASLFPSLKEAVDRGEGSIKMDDSKKKASEAQGVKDA